MATQNSQIARSYVKYAEFITSLKQEFGNRYKALELLYKKLMEVKMDDLEDMKRYLSQFQRFYIQNQADISSNNYRFLNQRNDPKCILGSGKSQIQLDSIWNACTLENKKVFWAHILAVSEAVESNVEVKKTLKSYRRQIDDLVIDVPANQSHLSFGPISDGLREVDNSNGGINEQDLNKLNASVGRSLTLTPIEESHESSPKPLPKFAQSVVAEIGKLSAGGEDITNPMELVMKLMSSGMINRLQTDLANQVNSGQLTKEEILGSVTHLLAGSLGMSNVKATP
jgi:hypothetical protein